MEQELQWLQDLVAQLQTENERLLQEPAAGPSSKLDPPNSSSPMFPSSDVCAPPTERFLYVP